MYGFVSCYSKTVHHTAQHTLHYKHRHAIAIAQRHSLPLWICKNPLTVFKILNVCTRAARSTHFAFTTFGQWQIFIKTLAIVIVKSMFQCVAAKIIKKRYIKENHRNRYIAVKEFHKRFLTLHSDYFYFNIIFCLYSFKGLLDTITSTADSKDCPGVCVHTLATLICYEVLEDVPCPSSSMKCCVESSPANTTLAPAAPTTTTPRPTTTTKPKTTAPPKTTPKPTAKIEKQNNKVETNGGEGSIIIFCSSKWMLIIILTFRRNYLSWSLCCGQNSRILRGILDHRRTV